VTGVASGTPTSEAVRLAVNAGHRRLPVYRESLDDILGVVRLSDLAAAMTTNPHEPVDALMTPVIATPESKPVIDLLREMQDAAVHLAIVVDEHGGTDGIVTIEDVVAQLVGDVSDEGRVPVKSVVELGPGHWSVGAGMSVAELEDLLDVRFPNGDWVSVGGLITGLTGRIPEPGAEITASGYCFRVMRSDGKRVHQVEVERIA
jgi:CBS domain containing-hemolysin-like protein